MDNETLKATVKYQDFIGTTAADRHDQKHLIDLATKSGIDTERYFVIGLQIHIGETRGDELGKVFVKLLTVDMNETKAGSIDFIQSYAREHGDLPFQRFPVNVPLQEILSYFKRFDMVLLNRQLSTVDNFSETFIDD